jgi:hypothetical protein
MHLTDDFESKIGALLPRRYVELMTLDPYVSSDRRFYISEVLWDSTLLLRLTRPIQGSARLQRDI